MNQMFKACYILFSTIFIITIPTRIARGQVKNNTMGFLRTNSYDNKSNVYPAANSARLENNITVPTVIPFLYCQKRPKFKLGRGVLLTFLFRLKLCQFVTGQPWFDEECANPVHDLTDYHKTSYDKVCNPAKYASTCQITEIKQNQQPSTIIKSWLHQSNIAIQVSYEMKQNDTFDIGNSDGNLTRIEKLTCHSIESYFDVLSKQVLQEDFVNFTESSFIPFYNVQYTEWFFTSREFCEDAACGVSAEDYDSLSVTFRDCVPESCHLSVVVAMVADGLIALLIVVANLLVLIIFFRTSVMKNIPGYFKLSLAIADLFVGLIVMPSIIHIRYLFTYASLPYLEEGMIRKFLQDYISLSYRNAIGFFTNLFFFVSIYTLCAASVDRYLAVTRPFEYERGKYFTKKSTTVILLIIWLIGVVLAVIPIFFNSIYTIFGSGLIFAFSIVSIAAYAFGFGIPLIVVWIFNIGLLLNVKTQNRKRSSYKRKRSNISCSSKSDRTSTDFVEMTQTAHAARNSETENAVQCFHNTNKLQSLNNIENTTMPQMESRKVYIDWRLFVPTKIIYQRNRKKVKQPTRDADLERRLAKTLSIMVGAFTIALLPCMIMLALHIEPSEKTNVYFFPESYSPEVSSIYTALEYISIRLFLSNSFWNCIIYSVRNRKFRGAIIDVFKCRKIRSFDYCE